MSQTVSAVAIPVVTVGAPQPLTVEFDARWAAWQDRGRLHDRSGRRSLAMAAATIVILAGTAYMLLSR